MRYVPENPLIVQSDHSLLLETMGPHFREVRDALIAFAELVKSPEYVHTYRITPLSLWNAAAAGHGPDEVVGVLERWSKYEVPPNVPVSIQETMGRYGRLKLFADGDQLKLVASDPVLMTEIRNSKAARGLLGPELDELSNRVATAHRGELKQALTHVGHPVEDLAGYTDGEALPVALRDMTLGGAPFAFRDYQVNAIEAFHGDGRAEGGSGVIVLPCGAGKTMVGIGAMARLEMRTLILCTNITALRQWKAEILDKTEISEDDVGEYSGETKEIKPVTLSTYQILPYRRTKNDEFVHFGLFNRANWGLIIYDEVHLLPAPIFRSVAQLQARRRLGLTATLVREDGKQGDVFALIGPKRFDVPWRELEGQGWIAAADCTEIRIAQTPERDMEYALAPRRNQFRIAAENPRKRAVVTELLKQEAGHRILVIGEYIDQLQDLAADTGFPLLPGKTPQLERERLYQGFRERTVPGLVLSRVGNFAVDLPDADVLVQVSGRYGSRQEEAQRLGRVLRPKKDGRRARFYTLVSLRTCEEDFARHRQLFLTEQGYSYRIETWGKD